MPSISEPTPEQFAALTKEKHMNSNTDPSTLDFRRRRLALLLAFGLQQRTIAALLKTSEQSVCKWVREPGVLQLAHEFQARIEARLVNLLIGAKTKALARLCEFLVSDDERIALQAAITLLGDKNRNDIEEL